MTTIYSLNCPITNQPRYIGKTIKKTSLRIRHHIEESLRGTKTHKCNWIRQLHKQNKRPIIEVVDMVDESQENYWEIFYISLFKSWGFKLTNGTIGGDGGRMNTDAIEKIRKAHIGKKMSDNHKNKISNSLKGRIVSEETKERLRKAKKGIVFSKEHREKLRLAKIGNKNGSGNSGKITSEETKRKISASNKGRVVSEETARKISNTKKLRFSIAKGQEHYNKVITEIYLPL